MKLWQHALLVFLAFSGVRCVEKSIEHRQYVRVIPESFCQERDAKGHCVKK